MARLRRGDNGFLGDHNRLLRFWVALGTDVLHTKQQLGKWYGLDIRDARWSIDVEVRRIKKTQYARRFSRVTFLKPLYPIPCRTEGEYRHVIGVAEMRHLLRADVDAWDNAAWRHGAEQTPDAYWLQPGKGETAIEYCAGSYASKTVLAKAEAFAEYPGGQVWGCATEKRADTIRALVRQVDTGARVLIADALCDEDPHEE